MEMQITTLEQAGKHLMEKGVVDFNDMTVEGKQLLGVCGYPVDDKVSQHIKRQVTKHEFKEGVDFNTHIDVSSNSRRKPTIYSFTINAANHVLLSAMTDKGKAARQEAIDLQTTVQSNGGEQMLMDFIKQQQETNQQFMLQLKTGLESVIKDKEVLIIKKSEPMSLTKLLGRSNKVVQAANLYLEDEGYQTVNFSGQVRNGWKLTDKGRELGSQIQPSSIFWVPEIKSILPNTSELLQFAERLSLIDMRSGV